MKKGRIQDIRIFRNILAVACILLLNFLYVPVYAASITALSDTMTRQKQGELSSHDMAFTLDNTFSAGESITIDFKENDSGFVVGGAASVIADFDFYNGVERTVVAVNVGAPSCSDGVNNVAIGIDDANGVVTILACNTYTASSAAVDFEYGTAAAGGTNRVTNPGSPTTVIVEITHGSDSGKLADVIILDDQIVYSATVDPTISFSLSANTSNFGTLSLSSITSAPAITATFSTNGNSGATITIYDAGDLSNPGLYKSLATTDLIGSADASYNDEVTLAIGVEGYGIIADTNGNGSGGTFTVGARYDHDAGVNEVGGLEVGPASAVVLATASAPINLRELVITAKAAIDGLNRAGSYQDTVTVIATANF